MSSERLDAFLNETIDLRLFLRGEEFGIVIALWYTVYLVKLLLDSLQLLDT